MDDYQKNDQSGYQNEHQDNYQNGWGQQGYYQNNQQGYYQKGYYQDQRRNHSYQEMEEPMTVGEWILTSIITAIPCVNIIMLFVWAFGSGAKKSKSNWAKAVLIFMLIGVILSIITTVILTVTGIGFGIADYYYTQFI